MRSIDDIIKDTFSPNMPANPLEKIITESILSYSFFAENILGMKLSGFHKEAMNEITNRYLLVIWPRGHLKTTMFTIGYTIWRLWKERGIDICIVSSSSDQSKLMIENIQRMIEDNEFLKDLIPERREDTWNKGQMNTTNGNRCFMKPFNSTARGMHVDYLIIDDILREENISQTQIKEYFWSIFYPTVQTRKGQIIMVGTPMTATDLFNELEDSYPQNGWSIIKKSAVILDNEGRWISPLWPERFDLAELEKLKASMGSLIFSREYFCKPKISGSNIFRNKKIGSHLEHTYAHDGYVYYMGIDVSMSGSKWADWLVFSVVAKDKDGFIKHVKQERYQGKDENFILKRTVELAKTFHPKAITIEQIGISIGVVNMMLDPVKFPLLVPIIKPFKMNRWSQKEELISILQSVCETQVLTVLDNQVLLDEMDAFQIKEDDEGKVTFKGVGSHDDCVMALALAVYGVQESRGEVSIDFVGPASDEEIEQWLKEEEEETDYEDSSVLA